MTHLGLDLKDEQTEPKGHRSRRRRRRRRAVAWRCSSRWPCSSAVATSPTTRVSRPFASAWSPLPTTRAPAAGLVLIEVQEGESAGDIGATLVENDVVKSVEAFTSAARANPASTGIQVGFYEMRQQMSMSPRSTSSSSSPTWCRAPTLRRADRPADHRRAREGDRLLGEAVREGPAQARRPSGCRGRTRTGRRRATCSPPPTSSAERHPGRS